jgi:hypothetical protein
MRRLMAVAASIGVLLTASLAHAQGREAFGHQGQFIISADRLVPIFSYTHTAQDNYNPGPGNSKAVAFYNQTSISLLWGSVSSTPAASDGLNRIPSDTFFTVPRVGFDYVIVPNVTIGGNVVVFFTLGGSNGTDVTANNGSTTTTKFDNPGALVFGVAPRGGYILPLTDLFSLWLRGGFSYYVASAKSSNNANPQSSLSTSANQFALDLDPQFVITPVPHFGFTVGLTADIPLAGGHSAETVTGGTSRTTSAWSSIFFLGVTGGILGYF